MAASFSSSVFAFPTTSAARFSMSGVTSMRSRWKPPVRSWRAFQSKNSEQWTTADTSARSGISGSDTTGGMSRISQ